MPNAATPAALLSLSKKEGLEGLAAALAEHGYGIVATGGTAKAVRALGIQCQDISEVTGFPPSYGGRLKSLHPKVFAGILARRSSAQDMAQLEAMQAPAFSVVAVALYPFEETVAQAGRTAEDIVEQIDIGGVALMRAAAKNFYAVSVLTHPSQYGSFIEQLGRGGPSLQERRALAAAAFARCEQYDAAIGRYMSAPKDDAAGSEQVRLPDVLTPSLRVMIRPRYGENPWAQAAFYVEDSCTNLPRQLSGKALSYNNLLDLDACLRLLAPMDEPQGFPHATAPSARPVCAAIVKHTVPCGVAAGGSAAQALGAALGADPVSAYGGIVACDAPVDEPCADLLQARFLEVVAAPAFEEPALRRLKAKKNLRLLTFHKSLPGALLGCLKARSALGGVLLEYPDETIGQDVWEISAGQPDGAQWRDLLFAFAAVRHVKSNAAVVAKDQVTLGICGGQTNRVAAVQLACQRAGVMARGAVLATDGFFPFADGLQAAVQAGVAAVVAPKGSIRDAEVVQAARRAAIHLVFANRRYFLH